MDVDESRCQAGDAGQGETKIANVDECLRGLSQLPGLVATGVLSTTKANSMCGVYRTLLQHHRQTENAQQDQRINDDLLRMLSDHPKLMSLMEPFLTQGQVESLIIQAKDGDNGPT